MAKRRFFFKFLDHSIQEMINYKWISDETHFFV